MGMVESWDVIIVGGGVIGSASAYFLAANPDFRGRVLVIERDPTYQNGSTGRSVGGIRQQFSTPENVVMSQFAAEFLESIGDTLAVDEEPAEVPFQRNGYLILASDDGRATLLDNVSIQHANGATTQVLEASDLNTRFPWLNTDDLSIGSFGIQNEGWTDPYALLQAFRKKARALGVTYLEGDVTEVTRDGSRVTGVRLASGDEYSCGSLVNAAGPQASKIAVAAGLHIPVHSRKRFVYVFDCRDAPENCPLTFDPTGTYFRPEGQLFICGKSPDPSDDPDCDDLDVDYSFFDDVVWPDLANRVPVFEAIKVVNAWAGHYAYNTLDQNAIIGTHPEIANMVFANGFSGHGLQQSPAVGRAVSEIITTGGYVTLDLTRLGFDRILSGTPIAEQNVY
jgi:FAD-dependent oxidoreductase domain-containing protein 1